MEIEKIHKFLEENQDSIIDYIQSQVRTTVGVDVIYGKLMVELGTDILLGKNSLVGIDKMHAELANAILETMWCGWLSQAKANSGAYPKEMPRRVREIILNAFEVGKDLAKTRP